MTHRIGRRKMQHCDLLVRNAVLVDAPSGVHQADALCVVGNRIVEIGRGEDLAARYRPQQTLDASGRVVLPGLINAHTHVSATLFRGYAADVAGRGFLERMWRIESLLGPEDVYVGALAGCAEMIRHGVTGFANHFLHMDQVARAVEETGLRAALSRTMLDRQEPSLAGGELAAGIAFAERWQGRCDRITPMLGPHAAYTCSDRLLRDAAQEARRRRLALHLHVAENAYERRLMFQRTGTTTVIHLQRLGFFDDNRVLGAHSLMLSDEDLRVLMRHDFHAAVCVAGKMHRGHGIADLRRLLDAGINVCLGTDGPASDRLDLLAGARIAHIAQNYLHGRPCALEPRTILHLATAAGADALHWPTGRLAPGQWADFILLDTDQAHLRPLIHGPQSNVLVNIIHYATGADVDTVVVNGRILMRKREMLSVDTREVLDRLQRHAERLWHEAARSPQPRSDDAMP
ncbi:MAG TPA: amidohydrolase [Planctomycetaceae bacterium]|nr:amidohydrolase [Planctomycetaceae bacterium]